MSNPLRRLPKHTLDKSGLILPSEESHVFREIKNSVQSLLQEIETMPPGKHRDQIMQAIEDVTNDGDIEKLYEVTKWRRTPVDLDEFMFSSVYLGLRPSEIYPGVIEDLRALDSGQYVEAVLKGAVGGGKALWIKESILTTEGWKTMGDLETGDYVFDEHGQPTKVLMAHPIRENRPCYRITFSDRTSIIADGEHNWFTQERNKKGWRTSGSVKTTNEIAITVYSDCGKYKRHSIPLIYGVDTDDHYQPIDPYVFGVWLGDGHSNSPRISNDVKDYEIMKHVALVGYGIADNGFENPTGLCKRYTITHPTSNMYELLRSLGVLGNKHIPFAYLYGSHNQRVSLLQGLMDTDGYMRPTGSCEIIQRSNKLADDIMQLLWLLGLKPERVAKRVKGRDYQRITFTVYRDHLEAFRLQRKLDKQPESGAQAIRQRSRYIVSVESVESVPVRCITVDSPNSLYCVGRQMQVTHNTTVANLGTLRQLYFISCLRTPQATFGVQRNSSIVFTIQSVRLSTAKKAVFQEMGAYIANSPYFTEVYPYDHRISSEMIFREQRVTIMPVSSSDTGAISMNVIGGLLDEMNFMERIKKSKRDDIDMQGDYDQAKNLYLNLSKRRRSRFMTRGKLPGILFLVSSSRYPDDFTETKAMESSMMGGNDPSIYVASRSLWEAKGRERFSSNVFRVAIGNENRRSEILPDSATPSPGMDIIEVPEDLKIEFEKDIDGSIRDLAGRTTLATHPFIRNRESIHECLRRSDEFGYRNIFELETYDLSVAVPRPIEENIRTDVDQMRVAHVDLATTGDAAGLSVGHVAGMRTVQRVNPYTSEITSETLPVVGIDFAMRIIPPQNGEIDFSKIRQIIFMLREEYGLPIKILTADGFNCISGDTQIWTTRGLVRADNVKVGDIVQSRVGARPIKKVWNYGIHKALQIVTKDGHSITVTDNHKLEVPRWSRSRLPLLTNGDGWKWQKASKFHVGDILHTWDGPTEVDVLNYDGPLTEDLACLYGMIYGDGNLQKDGVSISCHSTEIADCGAFVRRVVDARCTSLFYDGPNRGRVQFSSRSFVKHMKELGFDKKGLPNVLLEAPKRIQAAFLRGLFSTDGSVKRRDGQVSLSTKHKWVADYVRNFLRMAYGLATHTTITNPSKYDGSYINGYHVWSSSKKHYIVSVRGSRKNFLDNIGFVYSIKTISMEKHRKVKGRRIGSSIVSIKEVDATVFDFEVEDDHSYLANGFVSHNSVDFKQIMGKKGYVTDYLSLDRTTGPYVSFKNAMQDNRVLLPRSNILVKELVELEHTRNGAKEKVDHPARGSKDVADAVCGVVSTLLTRRSAWVGRPKFMGTAGFMMHGNRTMQPAVYLPTAEDIDRLEASPRKKALPRRDVDRKSRNNQ